MIGTALAALASTAAFAQSSVNLTGVVGFAYQKAPHEAHKGLTNTDATIAVSVSEDLGGGLRASAAIAYDAASSQFGNALNRRNTSIGLAGGFGSVSLANTRSSDLLTRGMVAPSNLPEGLYNRSGVVARVAVDALTYTAPAMSGFTPYIQYVEANTDGGTNPVNKITVLGANYANGPLAAGVAFKSTSGTIPAGAKKTNTELFATYDLGVARVGFGFDSKRTATDKSAMSFGVAAPMGAMTVGLNYAKRDTNKVTEVVARYDLSKRTNINASFGKMTADEATAGKGNQYRIGVYHAF